MKGNMLRDGDNKRDLSLDGFFNGLASVTPGHVDSRSVGFYFTFGKS